MSLTWQNPNPKLAWQGKHYTGPQRMTSGETGGDDRFYAPGFGPMGSSVVESPGFQAPPQVPIVASSPATTETSSPLDFLSSLPQWIWLAVAAGVIYWVFIKKGR